MALQEVVVNANTYSNEEDLTTIWGPVPHKQYTIAAQEIITHDAHMTSNTIYETVSRCGDLMGHIWYEVTLPEPLKHANDAFDIIESLKYTIGGQVIEHYSGQALRMLSVFDKHARPSIHNNTVVFPLRVCNSYDTHLFLPLVRLAFHEVKLKLKLADHIRPVKQQIHITYITLDTEERRYLSCTIPRLQLRITQKVSLTQMINVENSGTRTKIPLNMKGYLRDLIVLLKPKQNCEVDPMISMQMLIGGYDDAGKPVMFQRQNPLGPAMTRHVIPQQYYSVEKNDNYIYFMPFDHTPLRTHSTASLNMEKLLTELVLVLHPGTYDVHMLFRFNNILNMSSGMAGLQYDVI